jgi:predicted dehydrogenase
MMKLAVIGVGSMGRNHVRVLKDIPDIDLVGVVDVNVGTAQVMARRYGVRVFGDYSSLFEETPPDALVIAVPTIHHHEIAMAAIQRGMHLLVEKPIAAKVSEAQEMIDAARRKGVFLMIGHIERFNPAVLELKRRIDRGELGQVFMLHARRQSPYPGRIQDVGVASDLATHELDMMRYLANSEVAHMSAEVSYVLRHSGREDIIFGLLRFENGVLGILDVNWVTPTTVREISITGERGMFVVNYLNQDLCFYENPARLSAPEGTIWDFTVQAGNMTRFQINRREPLRSELEAFIESIRKGIPPPVDGADGLQALRLAQGIIAQRKQEGYESAR